MWGVVYSYLSLRGDAAAGMGVGVTAANVALDERFDDAVGNCDCWGLFGGGYVGLCSSCLCLWMCFLFLCLVVL